MHVQLLSGSPISINQEFHQCKRPSRSALALRQSAIVQAHLHMQANYRRLLHYI